jgi:anion-transporting  ArsA/GET3 family ATPase
VIFVLGKGGVGKSVIAASLGLTLAERGREVVLAEVSGSETMAALFDRPPVGYRPSVLLPRLSAISITADRAVEEYLVRTLRFRLLYELVFRNRFVEPFMNAVLGLSDLITVGKVMDLEWERADGTVGPEGQGPLRWDHIVVDAPATGHGLSLLRAPQAMMDVTRAGPLHANARLVRALVVDRQRTTVLLVTLPEDLPVTEAIEAAAELRRLDIDVAGIAVNAVVPPLLPAGTTAWSALRDEGLRLGGHAAAAIREADRAIRERGRATRHVDRLRTATGLPVWELPLLARRDIDLDGLRELGRILCGAS